MRFRHPIHRAVRRGLFVALAAGLLTAAAVGSSTASTPDPGASTVPAPARLDAKVNPSIPGLPSLHTATHAPRVTPPPGSGFYQWATAVDNTVADGAAGYYTIEKPVVAPGGHSLAEIAVLSANQQQAIEIGWTVDPARTGDNNPHLFVFHWINGQPTCYNGCGFVPGSNPAYQAGMTLPVTHTPVQFSILHHGAAWLVGYNGHNVGSFPDSEWNNTFKLTVVTEWFGEVNSPNPTTCTEMGNGQPASSPTAARIERMGYWPGRLTPDIGLITTSNVYSAVVTAPTAMRYGGPGTCATVPDIVDRMRTDATRTLATVGLVPGHTTGVKDPLCEDLDRVLSQSPAPGTRVDPGTAVDFSYGIPPKTGCPGPPK